MADVTSIYGNPIKDAVARADISTLQTDVQDVKDGFDDLDDRVTVLEQGGSGSGLTEDIKQALLQIASKVAYIDGDGQDYYDALEDALYPPADLVSISAVYTQSGAVYETDTLDSLKDDLVVTATYSDSSTAIVTAYTLSGTLEEGTSIVTVTYGGKTTTFNVTVQGAQPLSPISDYNYSASSQTLSISNGNHFSHSTSSNSRAGNVYKNEVASTNKANNPVLFQLNNGDSYEIKLKNIVVAENSEANNHGKYSMRSLPDFTEEFYASFDMTNTGASMPSDVTVSGTWEGETTSFNSIRYSIYRSCQYQLDLEFYINGVRYI